MSIDAKSHLKVQNGVAALLNARMTPTQFLHIAENPKLAIEIRKLVAAHNKPGVALEWSDLQIDKAIELACKFRDLSEIFDEHDNAMEMIVPIAEHLLTKLEKSRPTTTRHFHAYINLCDHNTDASIAKMRGIKPKTLRASIQESAFWLAISVHREIKELLSKQN